MKNTVIFDLDGTLLRKDKSVSDENKKAIDEKIEKLEKERNEAKGSTGFRCCNC